MKLTVLLCLAAAVGLANANFFSDLGKTVLDHGKKDGLDPHLKGSPRDFQKDLKHKLGEETPEAENATDQPAKEEKSATSETSNKKSQKPTVQPAKKEKPATPETSHKKSQKATNQPAKEEKSTTSETSHKKSQKATVQPAKEEKSTTSETSQKKAQERPNAQSPAKVIQVPPLPSDQRSFADDLERSVVHDLLTGHKVNVMDDLAKSLRAQVKSHVGNALLRTLSHMKTTAGAFAKKLHLHLNSKTLSHVILSPVLITAISGLLHRHGQRKAARRAAQQLRGLTPAQRARLAFQLRLLLQHTSERLHDHLRRIFRSLHLRLQPAQLHGLAGLVAQEQRIRFDDTGLHRATRLYLSRVFARGFWEQLQPDLRDTLVLAINSEVRSFAPTFQAALERALDRAKVVLTRSSANQLKQRLNSNTQATAAAVRRYLQLQSKLVADRVRALAGEQLDLRTAAARANFQAFVQQLMAESSDRIWRQMLPDVHSAFGRRLGPGARQEVTEQFLRQLARTLAELGPKIRMCRADIGVQVRRREGEAAAQLDAIRK